MWVAGVPGGQGLPLRPDCGVWDHERLAHRIQGERRIVADRIRHTGSRTERVRPVPEEQLVDHTSEQHPERMDSGRTDGTD